MNVAMKSSPPRHRIDVDQYYQLAEEGFLAPDARVELIDGEIIDMPPIGSLHSAAVVLLDELFQRAVQEHAIVVAQGPLRLDRFSQVQPDLQLLMRRNDRYRAAHATPADVFLVVEVSGSTLSFDRNVKVPLYARLGIPEVWIVDLDASRVQFFSALQAGLYQQVCSTATGGVINIILRRDYSGFSVDTSYGNMFDSAAETRRIDASAGFDIENGRTNILLASSFADGDDMRLGDSGVFQRGRARILRNNEAFFYSPFTSPPQAATTNIRSDAFASDGTIQNLSLKGSSSSR